MTTEKKLTQQLKIYTDGASRGNPGAASAAFVVTKPDGTEIMARAYFLGKATNNFAEYTAAIKALQDVLQINAENVAMFSDSELMVKQVNGIYKVKSPQIKPLYQELMELLAKFKKWKLSHVKREANETADDLANQALDQKADVIADPKKPATKKKPLRLGVMISGGGRTLLNILDHINEGKLNAEVNVVISSLSKAVGVKRAKDCGLKVKIVRKKDFENINDFSKAIRKKLNEAKVDLVIQAGWMCLWQIPTEYTNKVMNIHPGLLPAFGGKGMWGHHVHQAVLDAGCKVSGCTVHFCNNQYDAGPVIIQKCCEVRPDDDADSLAGRVFGQECVAVPEAIEKYEQNKIIIDGNRVTVKE